MALTVKPSDKLGQGNLESFSNNLHRRQAHVLLAPFHIGNVAAVYAQLLGGANLRPPAMLS